MSHSFLFLEKQISKYSFNKIHKNQRRNYYGFERKTN